MTAITRRYHFAASHRLHSPALSTAENASLYGKCNNPFGHGHDYILEVTVAGELDAHSGLIVPVPRLDKLVDEKVLLLFAHRNINVDVPQFLRLVPTTENVALVIAGLLSESWDEYLGDTGARLARVHVQETDRNGFEVLIGARDARDAVETISESVTVNA